MNSRERVMMALNHLEPDRVPLDLGATTVTGMHVNAVYLLRQALGLDPPGTPVKVIEPLQMLGEIQTDLHDALGVDTVTVRGTGTAFGYPLEGWKEWTNFQGIPTLVPAGFNTTPEPGGDLLMYPQGDRSAAPSGRMPQGGLYFDLIVRQPPLEEDKLRPEDNMEDFQPMAEGEISALERQAEQLYTETGKALVLNFGAAGIGNIARVPGPGMKHPRGIRDVEEWYISLSTRRDYIYRVFERQTEVSLGNLERIARVVGDRVTVIYLTGTDFGAQNGPFISPKTYRDLFQPFHKQLTGWIHQNTVWKVFIHSCGSVWDLLEDFIAAGFDVVNPVQTSAAKMDPVALKQKFGGRVTFWGGGVDTQQTLPFGSVEEVRRQVRERLKIFGTGGGYVFNPVHNIQAGVPVENVLAMFETVRKYGAYPLGPK